MIISKGVIQSEKELPIPLTDAEGYPTRTETNHRYDVKTHEEAQRIFEFIAKKTDVEWGNIFMNHPKNGKKNLLTTSHEKEIVRGGTQIRNHYFRAGYTLVKDDHTHPYGNVPSGDNIRGDLGVKNEVLKRPGNENAIFRILYQGKYYPF